MYDYYFQPNEKPESEVLHFVHEWTHLIIMILLPGAGRGNTWVLTFCYSEDK